MSANQSIPTKFPVTTNLDIAFPVLTTQEMKHWEEEAEQAQYDESFGRMASRLFFEGGKVDKRPDVSTEEYSAGRAYLQKWLGSFDPPHEVKELVAGYILSRISVAGNKQ